MRGWVASLICCLLWIGMPWSQAHALQFAMIAVGPTDLIIAVNGPIVVGDLARWRQELAAVPRGRSVIAVAVNSPGGNVAEGEHLAEAIRQAALSVVVPPNGTCASACFLLLAAAPHRFAASDAKIGVHGASENGEETTTALAATTAMARFAAAFGVPAAIVGKMVETSAGQVEWLNNADLASMNVRIINDLTPLATVWRTVQAQMAPKSPPVEFSDYARTPAATAGAPVTRFQGAFFCGPRPTSLSLTITRTPAGTPSRLVFGFGPTPTNPDVPRGSFIVRGRLDLDGGGLDLTPGAWLSHPEGYTEVGLAGRSDDGGLTFSGRVLAANCTLFTLRREP
ncbi:MAG TPA: ATP-dependent Clp protease proteolytic subunit [Acetobacteraceae bacterium]|jgi:hypothetical protein